MFQYEKDRICLPDDQHKPSNNQKCYMAGWGVIKEGSEDIQDKLRHVSLPLVSRRKCNYQESYSGLIKKHQLCAGYKEGGKDACIHDSGGSLACKVDGKEIFTQNLICFLIFFATSNQNCLIYYENRLFL